MAKNRSNTKLPKNPPEKPTDPLEGELGEQGDPMSPMTAWLGANPGADINTAAHTPYLINCQRNPYVYALRRMGYDVEALPNTDGFGADKIRTNPVTGKKEWDPTYGFRSVIKNSETAQVDVLGDTAAEEIEFMRKKMKEWGDGAIAMIAVSWNSGGGHVFTAEQINGETVFLDTQVARRRSSQIGGMIDDTITGSRSQLMKAPNGKGPSLAFADVNINRLMSETARTDHGARGTTITRIDNAEWDPEMVKRVCTKKRKE